MIDCNGLFFDFNGLKVPENKEKKKKNLCI